MRKQILILSLALLFVLSVTYAADSNSIVNCSDPDGGKNYFSFGTLQSDNKPTNISDICLNNETLKEYYCNSDSTYFFEEHTCYSGCAEGACISNNPNLVQENIKCIFINSTSLQNCSIRWTNITCQGIDSCTLKISDSKGKKINIDASCGEYKFTYINGSDKSLEYKCSATMPQNVSPNATNCSGCIFEGNCYQIGSEQLDRVCVSSGFFVTPYDDGSSCSKDYECSSEVCEAGVCTSKNFIQKIISWFKNLF